MDTSQPVDVICNLTSGELLNIFYKEACKSSFSTPLHAMRGVAAVIVLFHHVVQRVMLPFPNSNFYNPFNGAAAVTFFFLLSGLVLGASVAKSELSAKLYVLYSVRRVFRILPLLFFTVLIGSLYLIFVDPHMLYPSQPPEWGPLTIPKFISSFIGYSKKPNPPIWSIFIEIVASGFLPFMVASGKNKLATFLTGLGLICFGAFNLNFHEHWNFYMINFFVGLSILGWGKYLALGLQKFSKRIFWFIFSVLFLLSYCFRILYHTDAYGHPDVNLFEVLTMSPLIAMVFYFPGRFVFLGRSAFKFLGDVSFSLYLTHWVIVVAICNGIMMLFPSVLNQPILTSFLVILITTPLCLYVSYLTFRYIERPGVEMGARLCKFIGTKF